MSSLMDTLGDRMKAYEACETMRKAPLGQPLVARVDGKSFSKFTANMTRPWDEKMAESMIVMAEYLVENIASVRSCFVQSDEATLILDPNRTTEPSQTINAAERDLDDGDNRDEARERRGEKTKGFPFDGRYSKLASIIAGTASSRFALEAVQHWPELVVRTPPVFDCRVFPVPDREEAVNAILWRELDAAKNAASMAARAHFSHKRLHGLSGAQMKELLLLETGIDFNDYPVMFRRGLHIRRRNVERTLSEEELSRIPAEYRPAGPVRRTETARLKLPPLIKVKNRVEVIFDGAEPILRDQTAPE